MEQWAPQMESLWRKSGLGYPEFRWFLIWALRKDDPDGAKYGNDFTARNLRAARDPMASLVKQFATTFLEIFTPKADKVIPLLIEKREREEAAERLAAAAAKPTRWVEILSDGAQQWEIEKAKWMDADDAISPLCSPMAGESMEQWVERESKLLGSRGLNACGRIPASRQRCATVAPQRFGLEPTKTTKLYRRTIC